MIQPQQITQTEVMQKASLGIGQMLADVTSVTRLDALAGNNLDTAQLNVIIVNIV